MIYSSRPTPTSRATHSRGQSTSGEIWIFGELWGMSAKTSDNKLYRTVGRMQCENLYMKSGKNTFFLSVSWLCTEKRMTTNFSHAVCQRVKKFFFFLFFLCFSAPAPGKWRANKSMCINYFSLDMSGEPWHYGSLIVWKFLCYCFVRARRGRENSLDFMTKSTIDSRSMDTVPARAS